MAYNARRRKLGQPELDPLQVLGTDLAILDEIDFGLDVDALRDVSKAVPSTYINFTISLLIYFYVCIYQNLRLNFLWRTKILPDLTTLGNLF
ncbi:hypothetical protein HanRHA438_Chr15g0697681 [Helianthus annuus]|nr:hypothetical protein HanRHA438_Chr15g0697681 [Helianthus annuus]